MLKCQAVPENHTGVASAFTGVQKNKYSGHPPRAEECGVDVVVMDKIDPGGIALVKGANKNEDASSRKTFP